MKQYLIIALFSVAVTGFTACKNNNPSGTPVKNDTTFMNRNGSDTSSGGGSSTGTGSAASNSSTPTADTASQKKDSTKH